MDQKSDGKRGFCNVTCIAIAMHLEIVVFFNQSQKWLK